MTTYTVQSADVGKRLLSIEGVTHWLSASVGYIQQRDVGKRIYVRGYHLSMENDQQFKARLTKGA